MEIQMVDLKNQYLKIKTEINEAIQNVLNSSQYIKGPYVHQFEQELSDYLNSKHVIGCGNGTDALQIALMALDLKEGDEVIVPTFTYVATAEVIALLKLKPVMVDVDPNTFNLSVEHIKNKITPATKAIIPVHLFGQSADMESIVKLAQQNQLYIIEDNAQAIGAEYTFSNNETMKTGTIGVIGTTSFYPSKTLGCYGDGGAINCNDDDLAQKIRMISNHGQSKTYYHERIGINSRLDAIQAAILSVKLKYLDKYINARQEVAAYYDKTLAQVNEVCLPNRADYSSHVFHQYTLKVAKNSRNELRAFLSEKKIPTMIYYPLPLYRQKAFFDPSIDANEFPNTNELCDTVISLPIHTEMNNEILDYISSSVKEFYR
ncbi:MAG: DegT/DnrJ/EryC1/StrS family aminotransferase [Bacteroidetes bacterium]|nr:DegT/DnrJ/EryC1/StrS family aminotransferase [Bacteroidota bacterium]